MRFHQAANKKKTYSMNLTPFSSLPKVGLALSGGACRGAAHIGAIAALEQHQIQPSMISGTSIGALVAAFYAFGKTPEQMLEIAHQMGWLDMTRPSLSKMGLLSNQSLRKLIEKHLGQVTMQDAPIPLAFIATNLISGEKVVLDSGSVADNLMATTCVPGLMAPVEINGRLLVDGGLLENLPLSPLQNMGAEALLAIDLAGGHDYGKPDNAMDVLLSALDIALDNNARSHHQLADHIVKMDLSHFSRWDPKQALEIYQTGYHLTCIEISKIQQMLQEKSGVMPGIKRWLGVES